MLLVAANSFETNMLSGFYALAIVNTYCWLLSFSFLAAELNEWFMALI